MRCLMWFRDDLRISDNTALHHACSLASEGVVAIFILTPQVWQKHAVAACKLEFILRGLNELSTSLQALNIPLLLVQADTYQAIPELIVHLMQTHACQAAFFNKQYEVDELRRDQAVAELLVKNRLACHSYHDQFVIPPGKLLTQKGEFFKVFTPFKRSWLAELEQIGLFIFPKPKAQKTLTITSSKIPQQLANFKSQIDPKLWPAGETQAQLKLGEFINDFIADYHRLRDFPAAQHTSKLSPYLTSGMLSIRQCLTAAQAANNGQLASGCTGTLTWIGELIWREFYRYILFAFPRVSMHKPFQLATEAIVWDNDPVLLQAWQQGETGYPIVDAAMRQLQQTGWMHNRLRMVSAMFLSKTLFIDWRLGEKYFMQQLIDGDLASNNGGWQWCASTGTDAAPYFRIFNPSRQSERFDPDGVFIRQFCPELTELDNKQIHAPYANQADKPKLAYPKPIVDHMLNKQRVLAAFKRLKE